jgi:hypothetical protein
MIFKDIDFEYKTLKCHIVISSKSTPNTLQITFKNPDPNIDQGYGYFIPFEYNENMTDQDIISFLGNNDDFQQVYQSAVTSFQLNYENIQ